MSELLDRLRSKWETKQRQLTTLQTEVEQLGIAISVVEREEGVPVSRESLFTYSHNNGNGKPREVDNSDARSVPALVIETVGKNAEKGLLPSQIINTVLATRPETSKKYIYTVIGKESNKTGKIKRVGKRYFPGDL
jgi:hypothetical protein